MRRLSLQDPFTLNRQSPFARGLVGWWPVGNRLSWGTGTLRDMSLFGHDGTLTNMDPASDYTIKKQRRCLDFDAVNDQVTFGDHAIHDLDGIGSTIAVQVYSERTTTYEGVLSKWQTGTGGWNLSIRYDNRKFVMFVGGNGVGVGDVYSSANSYVPGNWHHVVVTIDNATPGTTVVRFYINGVSDASDSKAFNMGTTASPLLLGSGVYGNFEGLLDHPQIWHRILSDGEIYAHYRETLPGGYGSLARVWRLRVFPAAVAAGVAPTSVLYGPLVGPLGGPV